MINMGAFWAELPALVKVAVVIAGILAAAEIGPGPLAIGLVAAGVLNSRGWPTGFVLIVSAVVAVVAYVLLSLLYPRTVCWWCRGKPRVDDGSGNWRNCLVCGGSGQRRRAGAKLLRRHRRFIGR